MVECVGFKRTVHVFKSFFVHAKSGICDPKWMKFSWQGLTFCNYAFGGHFFQNLNEWSVYKMVNHEISQNHHTKTGERPYSLSSSLSPLRKERREMGGIEIGSEGCVIYILI